MIDETIAALEAKLETIAKELEQHSAEYTRVVELMSEQEKTQQQLDEAMERWVYLQEKYERIQAAHGGK